jgi:hypothetical protein
MKKSRCTEVQIVAILKEADATSELACYVLYDRIQLL